ncbi:MAG: sugar ABC transporter permease [Eubacteriales bacterium]|nr:sugar ABC transporter permease [Eubacteriales bacterium]
MTSLSTSRHGDGLGTKPRQRRGFTLEKKHSLIGWLFLLPATVLIFYFNFYPMIAAFVRSLHTGIGMRTRFAGAYNYAHMIEDGSFRQSVLNTFLYLIVQVPIMLLLALIFASLLNQRALRSRKLYRTLIFLPCATSLVSYALIFRSIFATDGLINTLLLQLGLISDKIKWITETPSARTVIIVALLWRWTGYNMVFYLSGLQNIEYSIYEAARIDGVSPWQQLTKITLPLLRPIILLTTVMSTSGTLQLFDESVNLTSGGPGGTTMTMSHYIYKTAFEYNPNFGYACAMSFFILIIGALLSLIQLKVGDRRD